MRSPIWLLPVAVLGLYDVTPVRAQDLPPLTFVGAGATEGYKLTRLTREFSETFRLARTDSPSDTKVEVEISVPDFLAPYADPTPVTVLVDNQPVRGPFTVPAAGVVVKLSAVLPVPATYTSQIKVTAPNKNPLVVPLQIIRSRVATTIEVKDFDAVPAETHDEVVVRFSLREISGLKTTFHAPDLSGLALIVANKRLQAQTTGLPAVSRLRSDGTAEALQPNQGLEIEPGAIQKFTIAMKGLNTAGEYGGTLHVTSPDGTTVDQAVTLLVHDPAWSAVLLILIGVAASMWLRWYYQTKRPEVVRSNLALEVLKQLDSIAIRPNLTDDAKDVVRSLKERVERAYERIQMGQGETAETIVNDVKGKLELLFQWVNAAKIVAALGASSIAPPIREKLDGVRLVLVRDGASATDLGEAVKKVQDIPGDIQRALADDYKKALAAIEAALEKRPGGSGHSAEAQEAIAGVLRLVDRAKAAFDAGHLPEARTVVSIARKQYVLVLADEMQASINDVPLGFVPGTTWTPIAEEIARLLAAARVDADPDRAWRVYTEARTLYIKSILRGLSLDCAQLTLVVDAAKARDEKDAVAADSGQRLVLAAASIASAQAAIDTDLDKAFDDAQAADRRVREVRKALEVRGTRMSQTQRIADFFRAAGLPSLASIDSSEALATLPGNPEILLRQLQRSFQVWELLVSLIIAGIAVLVGMKALWFGSNTWGGYADWTTAVLWGLGLHQFSFDSVNNLAQKFSK